MTSRAISELYAETPTVLLIRSLSEEMCVSRSITDPFGLEVCKKGKTLPRLPRG
ncbi:hypothetical protein SAMN04488092_10346 [Thalassovita taeanensis]|uniref:Uncharacterized protein n=1 Tax=Thalassovita taeanensis TaxID=657014 RepID=A0A1H9BY10_9RHOB|nr:hypothetical protein SAMN04488092_10346 [Thalassovita taeanensis]